jgi:hypothetical protein
MESQELVPWELSHDNLLPFVPRGRDFQYLQALQELLATDGRVTDQAIATRLNVTRQAVAKLRQREGFLG